MHPLSWHIPAVQAIHTGFQGFRNNACVGAIHMQHGERVNYAGTIDKSLVTHHALPYPLDHIIVVFGTM